MIRGDYQTKLRNPARKTRPSLCNCYMESEPWMIDLGNQYKMTKNIHE